MGRSRLVTLPRFVFTCPQTSRDEAWTVADLGMLVAMLGMFENQTSPSNAAFEDEDGEPVLVVQGDVDNVRFLRQQNGQPTDHFGSGHVRERVALRALFGTSGSRH